MTKRRSMKAYFMLIAGIMLATGAFMHAVPLRAGETMGETATAGSQTVLPEPPGGMPVAAQGMRVYRDPATGQLGPPPPGVQLPGLSATELRMLNRSDQGLKPRSLPGGGVAIDLQGRYQNMSMATLGEDGVAAMNCAATPAQAEAALLTGQQTGAGAGD